MAQPDGVVVGEAAKCKPPAKPNPKVKGNHPPPPAYPRYGRGITAKPTAAHTISGGASRPSPSGHQRRKTRLLHHRSSGKLHGDMRHNRVCHGGLGHAGQGMAAMVVQ